MSDPALLDRPRAVRPGEELPADRLEAFLRTTFPEVDGPVVVEQFPSGYSNLTYLVTFGPREMVLRRPPAGHRVKTGHDMGREVRVLSRLHAVYDLAPRPLAFCEDAQVLGTPFYLMERRRGLILRRTMPRGLEPKPETLARLGDALVTNLARLHAIDYEAAGLSELGKPEGYVERQVTGWTRRYQDSQTDELRDMDATARWLAASLPTSGAPTLIHNDFKYDNLVLDADDLGRVVAVLDWEMSTIGDPLMDLGVTLGYWIEAADGPEWQTAAMGPTHLPGSPTRRQLAERYAELTGRSIDGMLFYYVFALFKIAVIAQQIYFRYRKGLTQDPRFGQLGLMVALLAKTAVSAIERRTY